MSTSIDFMTKPHKFIYKCVVCGTETSVLGESGTVVSPGATHGEAVRNGMSVYGEERINGASRIASRNTEMKDICGGFGRMVFVRSATYNPQPPPVTTPAGWDDFAARVHGFWQAFKNSGYDVALRGVNNRGTTGYQAIPDKIRTYLSNHQTVNINGGTYTVSNSVSGGVSLHRTIPVRGQNGTVCSFIYHY